MIMEIINRQALKVVAIAYRRCVAKGSSCKALTRKNVFGVLDKWSHREVRLYSKCCKRYECR